MHIVHRGEGADDEGHNEHADQYQDFKLSL